jgi:hypothetical protein
VIAKQSGGRAVAPSIGVRRLRSRPVSQPGGIQLALDGETNEHGFRVAEHARPLGGPLGAHGLPPLLDVAQMRLRYRVQFTAEGEAAEQALVAFERHLGKPGELQATALHEILRLLGALAVLLGEEPLHPAKLHEVMRNLTERFVRGADGALDELRTPV